MMTTRENIVAAIHAGLLDTTPAEDRIHRDNPDGLEWGPLPAIAIKKGSDPADNDTRGVIDWQLELQFEVYASGSIPDQAVEPVIAALHERLAEITVGLAGVVNFEPSGATFENYREPRSVCRADVAYVITYRTSSSLI